MELIMPRTCIICGAPANSREHIFPAALGGLRVNRGIYCETHNNGFSDLANVLVQQFGMWNALLGVRDRDRRPRVLNVATPEGEDVVVSAGRVRRVDTTSATEDGIHLQLTLGGPEGLPAIGYVTLTFFAHYFGDMARQDGLAPIKGFLQGQEENQFVWWESETTTRDLPTNPFPFGHTIILTTSAALGEARAVISLFQTLTFGVALGRVTEATDRTITVFIDPHADRQPLDTQERRTEAVELSIEPPQPMHAHLQRLIYEGHGQSLLQRLMARIERWHFENEMGRALLRLNAARGQQNDDRVREIGRVVEEEAARVYRIMHFVVRDLRKEMKDQPESQPILDILDIQIKLNDNGGNLSNDAQVHVQRVAANFVTELFERTLHEDIDMEYLWLLFSGGIGMRIATRVMVSPIVAALGGPQNWGD